MRALPSKMKIGLGPASHSESSSSARLDWCCWRRLDLSSTHGRFYTLTLPSTGRAASTCVQSGDNVFVLNPFVIMDPQSASFEGSFEALSSRNLSERRVDDDLLQDFYASSGIENVDPIDIDAWGLAAESQVRAGSGIDAFGEKPMRQSAVHLAPLQGSHKPRDKPERQAEVPVKRQSNHSTMRPTADTLESDELHTAPGFTYYSKGEESEMDPEDAAFERALRGQHSDLRDLSSDAAAAMRMDARASTAGGSTGGGALAADYISAGNEVKQATGHAPAAAKPV